MIDDYGDLLEHLCPDAGWDGDDVSVTCPCGHRIEPDALVCADGCRNPIVTEGMI